MLDPLDSHRSTPEFGLLEGLFEGDADRVSAIFASSLDLDAPFLGRLTEETQSDPIRQWPAHFNAATGAYLAPRRLIIDGNRTVLEAYVTVSGKEGDFRLPIAVASERAEDGRLHAARIYHQVRPLTGEETPRHSPFPADLRDASPADFSGPVREYYEGVVAKDASRVLAVLAENIWIEGGPTRAESKAQLRDMYSGLVAGGLNFKFGASVDDGHTTAFEWVYSDPEWTEAGLACYDHADGQIQAIRMYDEIDLVSVVEPFGYRWK